MFEYPEGFSGAKEINLVYRSRKDYFMERREKRKFAFQTDKFFFYKSVTRITRSLVRIYKKAAISSLASDKSSRSCGIEMFLSLEEYSPDNAGVKSSCSRSSGKTGRIA